MKKIGIVIAMEEEFQAIENKIKEIKIHEEKGLKFFEGKKGDKECVIVKSGVGKVNAARTTQAMIDNFDIEYIINMGASGSIANDLNIGDIVIGKYVVQHDFDITAFGHNKGYITGVGDNVKCDKKLIKTLEDAARNNGKYKVKLGIVATGDIFCTDEIMKEKIHTKFDADVVDMECAAIAQVAYLNKKPFAVVRCISDAPNGENASVFDENLEMAANRCAKIITEFMNNNLN